MHLIIAAQAAGNVPAGRDDTSKLDIVLTRPLSGSLVQVQM